LKDIIIIGGPNGAGKTTAAQELVPRELGIREFVNADEIARRPFPIQCRTCGRGRGPTHDRKDADPDKKR
jgi:predicted ABC-type ATPase